MKRKIENRSSSRPSNNLTQAGAGWKPKGAKTLDGVGSKAVATKSSITNVFDKFKKANGKEESSKTGKFH